jgi:hypothetical protein
MRVLRVYWVVRSPVGLAVTPAWVGVVGAVFDQDQGVEALEADQNRSAGS